MADYISREAAVEKITFLCELREIVCNPNDEFLRGLKNALNTIKSNELIPSADVQPVRYGRWVECCNELDKKCSCCDKVHGTIYEREPFCPNCGARMNLKDSDTEGKVNELNIEVSRPDGNCLDCKFQYLEDNYYWCSICPGNPEDI